MNWLDIVFIFVFLLSVVSGLKRGMMLQLLDLFGFIASWLLAFKLGPGVGQVLDELFNISAFLCSLEFELFNILHLEEYAVTLIGVFFILALSGVVLMIVGRVLSIITYLPLIKQFNSLLGAAVGAAKGVLLILILIILVSFVPHPDLLEAKELSLGFTIFEQYAMILIDLGLDALTSTKV